MKQKTKPQKIYYVECTKCPLVVEGTSTSQVLYNLDVHIKAKHRRKKDGKRKGTRIYRHDRRRERK